MVSYLAIIMAVQIPLHITTYNSVVSTFTASHSKSKNMQWTHFCCCTKTKTPELLIWGGVGAQFAVFGSYIFKPADLFPNPWCPLSNAYMQLYSNNNLITIYYKQVWMSVVKMWQTYLWEPVWITFEIEIWKTFWLQSCWVIVYMLSNKSMHSLF